MENFYFEIDMFSQRKWKIWKQLDFILKGPDRIMRHEPFLRPKRKTTSKGFCSSYAEGQ